MIDSKTAAASPACIPFVRGPAAGEREDVLGVRHLYKARSAATGGLTVIETTVPPGAGAPMHVHAHEDEIFYVLDGEIVVRVRRGPPCDGGGERRIAGIRRLQWSPEGGSLGAEG